MTTADVMTVLLPIWTRKHAMARTVRHRIGTVMLWAIARGYRSDNPAGDAITAALPKRPVLVQHRAALPHGNGVGIWQGRCQASSDNCRRGVWRWTPTAVCATVTSPFRAGCGSARRRAGRGPACITVGR
ncbi:MAG: hypothetical protein OXH69_09450 [Acidobacteria bacterium]|nr:hypothetical protein [Acidobacteriota bacterium]